MESRNVKDHALPAYHYQPLAREAREIRLVKLIKGSFDDDLEIQIVKASLKFRSPTPAKQQPRLTIQELQRTIPPGQDYVVRMNLEGRYVFARHCGPSTFEHPDPTFDRSLYEKDDVSIELQPTYDALSYTWGVSHALVKAYVINDTNHRVSSLTIGTNLATALKYLRLEREDRNLWIDALSINQRDIGERNYEVKRMGEIYARARNTIIWLGEAKQDTELAISTLQYFAEQVEFLLPYSYGDRPGAEQVYWYLPERELPYDERTWTAIHRLFESSWFTRTWVLQECEIADTRAIVQCGQLTMAWSDMRRAMAVMRNKYLAPPEVLSVLVSFSMGFQARYCRSMSRLMAWTKTRHCADPRDKVYGILGLTNTEFVERITPDYGTPLLDLYRHVFLEYSAVTRRLDLLAQCILSQRLEGAPSWVPNWSAVAKGPVMDIFSFGSRRYASSNSAAYTRKSNKSLLEILGTPCARITQIIALKQDHSSSEARMSPLLAEQMISVSNPPAQKTYNEEFVNMVFATRRRRHKITMQMPTLEGLAKSWQMNQVREEAVMNDSLQIPVEFARCDDDMNCIVPPGTMAGDSIYVILGCELPLVLRKQQDDSYLIIGACLKPNIMSGECLMGPFNNGWELGINDLGIFQDFFNTTTKEHVGEDPRLEPLSSEWEVVEQEGDSFFEFGVVFRNKMTGEEQKFDPRLSPERLMARGVRLEWLKIV